MILSFREKIIIVNNYAEALFKVVKNNKNELEKIRELIVTYNSFFLKKKSLLILKKMFAFFEKKNIVWLENKFLDFFSSKILVNFILLILKNNDYYLFVYIFRKFLNLADFHLNTLRGTVYISESQLSVIIPKIKKVMCKNLRVKKIFFDLEIDSNLIFGFKIKLNNNDTYDYSFNRQLSALINN